MGFAVEDPVMASKFNRPQLSCVRQLLYQFRQKPGLEIGTLRSCRSSTSSPFNHGTNQYRSPTGQEANFAKRDNAVFHSIPSE